MSKIKDEMERIRQEEFEQYVSFMEWVCDQKVSVSEEIEEEERSEELSTPRTSILSRNALNPVNNPDYNPTRSIR